MLEFYIISEKKFMNLTLSGAGDGSAVKSACHSRRRPEVPTLWLTTICNSGSYALFLPAWAQDTHVVHRHR